MDKHNRFKYSADESQRKLKFCLKKQTSKLQNRATYKTWLFKRLPIIAWFSKYKKSYLANDITSGLTIGVMSLPQSMGK
jgi:hypothetical protein